MRHEEEIYGISEHCAKMTSEGEDEEGVEDDSVDRLMNWIARIRYDHDRYHAKLPVQ